MTMLVSRGQINPNDACPAAALAVNASCVLNTYVMSGAFANGALVAPTCPTGTDRDDGWYSFVATATAITVEETSSDRTHLIEVWNACGAAATISYGCANAAPTATAVVNAVGLTIGTTYYIQLQRRSGISTSSMNGTICVYQTPDPDAAWPGADLGTLTCAGVENLVGSTAGETTDCGVSSAADHIYKFTLATDADVTIKACASSYDTQIHLFNFTTGSCAAGPMDSNDDDCGVQSRITKICLPAGSYVLVIEGSGAATGAYNVDILVTNCSCNGPDNDEPCTATPLAVGATCTYTTDDNTGANDSQIANPSCGSYGGEDLWYTAIVPASGQVSIETTSGTLTDGVLTVYTGTCGELTEIVCDNDGGPDNMSYVDLSGLTPGATLFIRISEDGGNAVGTFNICIYDACGGHTTNDYCEDPADLFLDAASSFASSTAGVYTHDNPDDVETIFCGTIQNNSWYKFTATATTHSFDITSVVNCTVGDGIQGEVYSYSHTLQCCEINASVSNCFNPATATTGTITATGLTIGEVYVLMIDGWAGDSCDFVIDGWSATGVLPVELVDFKATKMIDRNHLTWTTKSELGSQWFRIERSTDGKAFVEIGKIQAAGNSSNDIDYYFDDTDFAYSLVYYRLKEVDFDGKHQYSNVVTVLRDDVVLLFPNPTSGEVNLEFTQGLYGDFSVVYTDVLGRKICEEISMKEDGQTFKSQGLVDMPGGIYFVEILNQSGQAIYNTKVIRN
jgi:hypothetical protein